MDEPFVTAPQNFCTHVCPVHGKTVDFTMTVHGEKDVAYGPFCGHCIGEALVKNFEIVRPIKAGGE